VQQERRGGGAAETQIEEAVGRGDEEKRARGLFGEAWNLCLLVGLAVGGEGAVPSGDRDGSGSADAQERGLVMVLAMGAGE
jgi:hypothetical protein